MSTAEMPIIGRSADILVVDDSPSVRERLRSIIEADPRFAVRAANDPYEAVAVMKQQAPDAIVLDVEMPRMDGITFLKKLMRQHPLPVIICTDQVERGLQGLELGAIEVIGKPVWSDPDELSFWSMRLRESIRQAVALGLEKRKGEAAARRLDAPLALAAEPALAADVILSRRPFDPKGAPTDRIVAIGASTGGVQAIQQVLRAMPVRIPATVIVQHMPEAFTEAFAIRLDTDPAISPRVVEGFSGQALEPGVVYLVPGSAHGLVRRVGPGFRLELAYGPPVSRHRPSVDVLFRSVAQVVGPRACGVLLTGMGADGAAGLLEMKESGAHTIAQDEATSVVFGMPREAIKRGAAGKVLPLDRIADAVLRWGAAGTGSRGE